MAKRKAPPGQSEIRARPSVGLVQIDVHGFRSARDVTFAPGRICALVGEAKAGKSNLFAAIRALLDPAAPPIGRDDLSIDGDGSVMIRGELASGEMLVLEAAPPKTERARSDAAPPTIFLPAGARASSVLAASEPLDGHASHALALFRSALAEQLGPSGVSATAPALGFVDAIERCAFRVHGLVLLIEEPELYLRPQAQRYLYRLLRQFAAAGNQVIYSTHSPAFLNVARLNELVFVERAEETGTRVIQPQPVGADDGFRVLTEFDAERSELFLAQAAVLVEGMTEKLILPFVFQALGYDPDREGISIVGAAASRTFRSLRASAWQSASPSSWCTTKTPPAGRQPIAGEAALNELIAEVVGRERTIVLEPDFEGVTGLQGHSHKPERAWRRFASLPAAEMPEPLVRAAKLALGRER